MGHCQSIECCEMEYLSEEEHNDQQKNLINDFHKKPENPNSVSTEVEHKRK